MGTVGETDGRDELGVGAALAATLAGAPEDRSHAGEGDRDDAAARMAPDLERAFRRALAAVSDTPDRATALRVLARRARRRPRPDAPLSSRARALLSPRVDPATGRAWLAAAPPTRRGYRPPAALVDALERATTAHAYRETADDRGRGRALLATAIRRAARGDEGALLRGLDAEEAAAVLALAALEDREALRPPEALLAAALAVGGDRVLALGALARGSAGGADSDSLGRAGRELEELGLAGEDAWRG